LFPLLTPTYFSKFLLLAVLTFNVCLHIDPKTLIADDKGVIHNPVLPISKSVLEITFSDAETQRTVVGQPILQAADGGVMLLSDEGRVWRIQPDQIVSRKEQGAPFRPISLKEAGNRIQADLGAEFQVFQTAHYAIIYNGNERHARGVGELLEQIHRGFHTFWRNQGLPITEPTLPLVALVFRDEKSFRQYADAEIGDLAEHLIGYYHLETNRMICYDVPNWERNVSTIIHEGTHQLAYNCGLQTRLASNPMWVSEGLAIFFEAPDRRNPKRWRGIGSVNAVNWRRWWDYFPRRPSESLVSLISDDERFQNASTAMDAYGESWALTYFLIRSRSKQYYAYLQRLSEGQPMVKLSSRERIELFESVFETTIADLDRQFIAYMRKVKLQ
jgi:Protein of unknown function (DUF1570)